MNFEHILRIRMFEIKIWFELFCLLIINKSVHQPYTNIEITVSVKMDDFSESHVMLKKYNFFRITNIIHYYKKIMIFEFLLWIIITLTNEVTSYSNGPKPKYTIGLISLVITLVLTAK